MKKLLLIAIMLISISACKQNKNSTGTQNYYDSIPLYDDSLSLIGTIRPAWTATFFNSTGDTLILTFTDTMKVSGNVPLGKSAKLFLNEVRICYQDKIDSLNDKILTTKKELNSYKSTIYFVASVSYRKGYFDGATNFHNYGKFNISKFKSDSIKFKNYIKQKQ